MASTGPLSAAVAGGIITNFLLSPINEVPTVSFIKGVGASELLLVLFLLRTINISNAISQLLTLNTIFWGVLITVTILRRLFFHPLSSFPGSKLFAISKIPAGIIAFRGRNAPWVASQHEKLGDFVRVGPNELSINHVDAISLFSRQPYNSRGPLYEMGPATARGCYSLFNLRENSIHKVQRRIWEAGFKTSALANYNPRVEFHINKFIRILEDAGGETINFTSAAENMTFDIMADLGFGLDGGVQDGADRTMIDFMHKYMSIASMLSMLRNLCDVFPYIPRDKIQEKFLNDCEQLLQNRLRLGKSRPDVFSHLLAEDQETGVKFTHGELAINAQLLIIAGSDTTSSTIVCIARELALNKKMQERLYAEVSAVDELNCVTTKDMPYLQGVVNEGLRLWNAVPSGAQAIVGPEGATIAGRHIPPNTIIRVPHITILRDERYFTDGKKFMPERWTDMKGTSGVKDMRAFIPFSYGQHVCVGKQMALSELRLAVARIVRQFQIELGEGYSEEKFLGNWRDYFTVSVAQLPLRLVPRE